MHVRPYPTDEIHQVLSQYKEMWKEYVIHMPPLATMVYNLMNSPIVIDRLKRRGLREDEYAHVIVQAVTVSIYALGLPMSSLLFTESPEEACIELSGTLARAESYDWDNISFQITLVANVLFRLSMHTASKDHRARLAELVAYLPVDEEHRACLSSVVLQHIDTIVPPTIH
jgi:hypothetical protein